MVSVSIALAAREAGRHKSSGTGLDGARSAALVAPGGDEKAVGPGLDLVASAVLMVLTRFMKLWGRARSAGGWDPLSLSGWLRCLVAPRPADPEGGYR